MKIVALIVNFLVPGIGSMLLGYIGTGIAQLLLYGFGMLLTLTGILWIVGAPISFIALVWSLITAGTHDEPEPRYAS